MFSLNAHLEAVLFHHGGNTIGPTCPVDQADHIPYMKISAVD